MRWVCPQCGSNNMPKQGACFQCHAPRAIENRRARKQNVVPIVLGSLAVLAIAGFAATKIKTPAATPFNTSGAISTALPQVRISWTQGGVNAGGQFENLTDAPLRDVALECYVAEPNEVRGITTGSERIAYHALFDNAGQEAYRQWMMRFEDSGPGARPSNPTTREAPTDHPPLVAIGPHQSVGFFVRKSSATFPIELRATAQGVELAVSQVAPHY